MICIAIKINFYLYVFYMWLDITKSKLLTSSDWWDWSWNNPVREKLWQGDAIWLEISRIKWRWAQETIQVLEKWNFFNIVEKYLKVISRDEDNSVLDNPQAISQIYSRMMVSFAEEDPTHSTIFIGFDWMFGDYVRYTWDEELDWLIVISKLDETDFKDALIDSFWDYLKVEVKYNI